MRNWASKLILLFALLLLNSIAYSQSVSGVVRERTTNEGVPFVNVVVKGLFQGVQTDLDGNFTLNNIDGDTIVFSSLGYNTVEYVITNNEPQQIEIFLDEVANELDEVVASAKTPFSKVVFRNIQKHKKENHNKLKSFGDYSSLQTTTVYLAVDTLSKNIKRLIKDLDEVTIEQDGQDISFTPIYIKQEAFTTEGIEREQISEETESIIPRTNPFIESYLLINLVGDIDFYDEQINILDRGFISPIASTAPLYYNIFFIDTVYQDDTKQYLMSYTPKNPRNPLFSGSFIVDADTYALTKVTAAVSKDAHLNFINGYMTTVTYQTLPDGKYFYGSQSVDVNMSLITNKKDSTQNYSAERVDNIASGNWMVNKLVSYSNSNRLAEIKPQDWSSTAEFNKNEVDTLVYNRLDKIRKQRLVKEIDKLGGMALTGFYNLGKFDLGPIFNIYSTNKIEGSRITAPFRTSSEMWEDFSVGGFLGYGTESREFKYGLNLDYRPEKKLLLRLKYYDDYNLVSQDRFMRFIKFNPNTKGNSNFIGIFTSTAQNPYLKEEKYLEGRIEYNFNDAFHIEASPYMNWSYETDYVKFSREGVNYANFNNYGILFDARWSFNQHYDDFFFDRVFYVNPIPVVHLGADIGRVTIPDLNEKFGMYAHMHGSIQGRLLLGQMFINYMLNGGYLVGDAPWDQLDLPVGSMSYGYSKFNYNLLHFASFAHNLYTNFHCHLNGGGVIMNKIPLIRALQLREVVSLKLHYGGLTSGYNGVLDMPTFYDNSINKPYGEIGFGFTNILKVLRAEYVMQLGGAYKNASFADRSGIFFRAEMSF